MTLIARTVAACCAGVVLAPGCGVAQERDRSDGAVAAPGWVLTWSDEFDGPALDGTRWRVEHAALTKNNELQYYLPDEVYLEDGCLVLRSREREHGGRRYTSGLVDTQNRFSQAFGRFEVRAKLPKGRGIWPAHWMLPDDHPAWPPEIDIMELLGHEPDTVHLTQHWGTWPNNASHGVPFVGPDFSEGFHVFTVEWSPDRIDWFVDGELRHSSTESVPRIPFYLILNTAVGGDWPGNPDATTTFPQHHLIDYVRVYRRASADRPVLAVESVHGAVAVDPPRYDFAPGETAHLAATPDFGYTFVRWEGPGLEDDEAGRPSLKVSMDRSRSLRAIFAPDPGLMPRLPVERAEATSVEAAGLEAGLAVDGLPGTRWASSFAAPQSLTLDLGTTRSVQRVRLLWENAYAAHFRLLASLDGETWSVVADRRKADPAPDLIEFDAEARYIRLDALERATQWGISVWEFEVYGR